jgi:MinD superfamily P-loop ATPase
MKQIVILSGKGGTGKTTIAAALAHLTSQNGKAVMVDADVDASNLELVLSPTILEESDFSSGKKAVIDPAFCTACGICGDLCRFDAIVPGPNTYRVDPITCEGCALCYYQCPTEAIRMEDVVSGQWFRSETRFGPLFHARLHPGEENSGKLVTMVRQKALQLGREIRADWIIVDGSPGIGCPVIAAATGADLALLVTEPTLSGIHDLQRILKTTEHFRIPSLVCVNKADINLSRAAEIADYCKERGVPVVAEIPYDDAVTQAMVRGQTITETDGGAVAAQIRHVWDEIQRTANRQKGGVG